MLLSCVKRIPFLGSAFSFPWAICRRSATEVFFLWVLSSLPLFLSVAAKVMDGKSFHDVAAEEVSIKAIFLYTSAFLAPVLYLLIERLIYPRKNTNIFSGAGWIFLGTLLIWGFSSWLYQNEKIPDVQSSRIAAYGMYAISIYFWWLAIADSRNSDFPYEKEVTQDENDFADIAAGKRKENAA